MGNLIQIDHNVKYGLSVGLCRKTYKSNGKEYHILQWSRKKLSKIENVILYSNKNSHGVVAFNIKDKTSTDVANILDKKGFEIRSGLHCAPKVHEYYKTTNVGICRVGLSYFNSMRQLKKFIRVIKEM